MKNTIDKKLLQRYIENKCTEAEIQIVEEWISNPRNEKRVREFMEQHWLNLEHKTDLGPDLSHVQHNLIEQIERTQTQAEFNHKIQTARKTITLGYKIRIAAAVLIVIIGTWILYLFLDRFNSIPQTTAWVEAPQTTLIAKKIKQLTLPDGTQVWLNAKSSLRYSPDFNGETREVFLEGEAYFDVKKDKNRPFIVYTQDIQVKVLGTAFTVKSYKNDNTSETTLVRGKVRVEKYGVLTKESIELLPNQRVVYTRNSEALQKSEVVADQRTTWKEGTLRFENEPLDNVIKTMERWYDVRIVLNEVHDAECRLTASIDRESLEEMLQLLKTTTGITYTVSENIIYIDGKICQ
jgi:transmembrane sensor